MKTAGIIFSDLFQRDIPELTYNRTLASIPFAGRYRLIDFTLSNMVNSGISRVGVITKYNYQSLMDHVESGKNWDLSRKNGGLEILPPFNSTTGGGIYTSRFEAIANILTFLRKVDADVIVMSDCDIVCNFDFSQALAEHKENNADFTMIYRDKDIQADDTRPYILLDTNDEGRVTNVYESYHQQGMTKIYANMLIANKSVLIDTIINKEMLNIKSFTHDVLFNVQRYRIFEHKLTGFYASIDGLANYYKHSMMLLDEDNKNALFYANGTPIYTKVRDSVPLKLTENAQVTNSIIADGCIIEGEVSNSILFRGVRVEKGAKINNSIVFQGGSVAMNSELNCVIMEKYAKVLEGRKLSGHSTHPYFIGKRVVI